MTDTRKDVKMPKPSYDDLVALQDLLDATDGLRLTLGGVIKWLVHHEKMRRIADGTWKQEPSRET